MYFLFSLFTLKLDTFRPTYIKYPFFDTQIRIIFISLSFLSVLILDSLEPNLKLYKCSCYHLIIITQRERTFPMAFKPRSPSFFLAKFEPYFKFYTHEVKLQIFWKLAALVAILCHLKAAARNFASCSIVKKCWKDLSAHP